MNLITATRSDLLTTYLTTYHMSDPSLIQDGKHTGGFRIWIRGPGPTPKAQECRCRKYGVKYGEKCFLLTGRSLF